MEFRVHGIGGTSAASMLDQAADDALVPRWPRGPGAVPHVWQGSRPDVVAYHWARLTSGSRWFVLWPLALPFTLLNVAGFMHATGKLGRSLRILHGVLCLVATAWFSTWLLFGGQEVAGAKRWDTWIGLVLAGAVAVAVVAPSAFTTTWKAGRADRRSQPNASLENPEFFRSGAWLWALWALHALTLLGAAGAVWLRYEHDDTAPTLAIAARKSVVDVGIVLVILLWAMMILTLLANVRRKRRPWQWMFSGMGTIGVGAALIGGLMMALLRVLIGSSVHGTPFVLFDVYGVAALVAIGVGGTAVVATLGRASPGERLELAASADERRKIAARVLPHPGSWFRARVALVPRALALAVGAAVVAFVVVGTVAFVQRAPAAVVEWEDRLGVPDGLRELLRLPVDASSQDELDQRAWNAGASPPVRIAHFAIYGLFVVMFVNLLKSYGAASSLRRIGSVWDVLTFWPRRYHPFAVRPYTECAVDQLRELLFTAIDPDWPEDLTVLAHSQGSMLVVAALAPGVPPDGTPPGRSRVRHLVTVGSPLRSLYMKAFPSYVPEELIDDVTAALERGGQWTNTFRFTDHVGRTVFTDERAWVPDTIPPLEEAQDRWWLVECPAHPGCCDCVIADPDAKQARVLGHNDYWEDRRVRKVVGRGHEPADAPQA
jgi:hypothetical protein